MNKVDVVEQSRLRKDIPPFRPGDQVKVHVKVTEGTRERIQVFEGVVLGRRGGGLRETFTVRKISFGVGVERTFPIHGPAIDKVEIVRHGKVRRAKLYYLRDRIGRRAKIDERRTRIQEWDPEAAAAAAAEPAVEEAPEDTESAEVAEAAIEQDAAPDASQPDASEPEAAAPLEAAPEASEPEPATEAADEPAAEAAPEAAPDTPAEPEGDEGSKQN